MRSVAIDNRQRPAAALVRAMPWIFVLIWSTGFVVARFGMPYAPPLTFLSMRYALSLVCFVAWIRLARVDWPSDPAQWGHLAVVGVLIHAGYLGGVWSAVKAGIGASTVALLVGLQPVTPRCGRVGSVQAPRTGRGCRCRQRSGSGSRWASAA